MNDIKQTELGLILLTAEICCQSITPLTPGEYRHFSRKVASFRKQSGDMNRDITPEDIMGFGCGRDQAGRIFRLLEREDEVRQELDLLSSSGIYPITRISPGYPERLASAPTVFFACGDRSLLGRKTVSLVGSRDADEEGLDFAAHIGKTAASEGYVLVSGGARGSDRAAEISAMDNGGAVISILPGSLAISAAANRDDIRGGRLLLLSALGPDLNFSAARALERNRYIHMLGEKTFVAQSSLEAGGTWAGSVDNLKNGWSHLYVFVSKHRGNLELIRRGGVPVKKVRTISAL